MRRKVALAAVSAGALLSLGLGGSGHSPVEAVVQSPSAYIGSSIDQWNALRQTQTAPFESYSSFLLRHRGWPGQDAMRRSAERQITPGVSQPAEVVRFFTAFPPLTATGHAYHALALRAQGRPQEALDAARRAWAAGAFSAELEQRMLATFGPQLTAADHDRRIDALLNESEQSAATRMLSYGSPARRPIYDARIALQARAPNAVALASAAGLRDPGLLYDRARYLNRTGNPGEARRLMAQRRNLDRLPGNPEQFMELMVSLARGAANDGQHSVAYNIASQVDDIYPAGTDVSAKSFGERDEYTNLTWLAGTTALRSLRQPADAIGMFERYGRASQSPQSQTKGLYWAARAASNAGREPQARALFGEAARHYDQYYGQLSAERIGQPLRSPPSGNVAISAADRQAFDNKPLVAAVRYLGQRGSWTQQSLFVRALAEDLDNDAQRQLAAELGRQVGRRDLGVLASREGRRQGASDVYAWGFPELRVPPANNRHWSVVHGITRQESLFDREAVSSAGARGLMQLMPATARQVSGQLGQAYSLSRLTSDPDFNVLLGSTYFASLLDQWGGSYPLAIASYNAGPGNARRFIRENGDPRTPGVDMVEWIERIPFTETRNYVQRVLENAVVYDLMYPQQARSPANGRLSYYLGRR
ncbi:MAG TPA: lytic transglycosylase domain-containing protein [Allosphingosinicella sp.]